MILDQWQKEIIEHDGNVLLCTGRQVGKSTVLSIKACRYALAHKGSKLIICSLTEDQARLIIIIVLDYLQKNFPKEIDKGKDKPTMSRITLKNKSQIIARPVGNTGDAVRGFTGDVLILDEVSRFNEIILEAAKPTLLTTGGQLWMASTPFGKKGYFYESFLNKYNRFKVWHISSEEVIYNRKISEDWTEKKRQMAIEFLENEKKDMSELAYGQEYLGQFMEDLNRFFPDNLIMRTCTKKRPAAKQKGKHILGVDIARLGDDETTFEILNKEENGEIKQVENIVKTKILTTETEAEIIQLSKEWDVSKIGIDAGAGSLGVGIFDRLMQRSETKNKTIAINNRSIVTDIDGTKKQKLLKEDLYDNLKNMMEREEIKLLDDENVIESLRSIQIEFMTIKDMPTRARIFGRYSHIAEGLIRAAWLAKKEKTFNIWVRYS